MTRISILIFQFIILVTFLLSCTKPKGNNTNSINSIVVDYVTKRPMPGQKVYLVNEGARLMLFSEPWKIEFADTILNPVRLCTVLDSTITDANGRFNFRYTPIFIPIENVYLYPTVKIIDNSLFRIQPFSPRGQTLNDSIFIDKKAFLKLNIQKIIPPSVNDTIFQNVRYLSNIDDNKFPGINFLRGQVGKTNSLLTYEFPYSIYDRAIIEWRHYNSGVQNSHVDTVVMNPAGNTVFNIVY